MDCSNPKSVSLLIKVLIVSLTLSIDKSIVSIPSIVIESHIQPLTVYNTIFIYKLIYYYHLSTGL